MQEVFVEMLGANPGPAAAIYMELRAARKGALEAVATFALVSDDERDVFTAILKAARSAEGERNEVAHGVWGHSDDLPNAVLLCHPDVLVKWQIARNEFLEVGPPTAERRLPEIDRTRIFVWTAQDFINVSARIQTLMGYTSRYVLHREGHLGAHSLQELLETGQILTVVEKLRKDREKTRPQQP